jgi:hypothetical protein
MNAHELADAIEDWETGANYTIAIKAGQMLRQQAEKIKNMEIWEKKYLDRIEGLEAERDYIKREWLGGLVKIAVLEKTQELKELSDEEIRVFMAEMPHLTERKDLLMFARAILKKASEK